MAYEIVKSAEFCGIECDFYSNEKREIFMTINQLSNSLGYANRKGIEKMIERNAYLKGIEFSVADKMTATDGKQYDTRLFTEDGIYEVTMLAKTEKAKEFRAFVRKIVKSIRKGESYSMNYQELSPQLQYLISLEKKQNELEVKQNELEAKISNIEEFSDEKVQDILSYGRISYALQKSISRAVKFQCIKICQFAGTYEAVGKKVESRIYRDLQKEFNVPSYRDLRYNQVSDVLVFVEMWEPDLQTSSLIASNLPKANFNIFSILSDAENDRKEDEK